MKTIIGFGLIILGFVSIVRYPNFGMSFPETLGALLGIGIIAFLPGILLIKSDNKNKTE